MVAGVAGVRLDLLMPVKLFLGAIEVVIGTTGVRLVLTEAYGVISAVAGDILVFLKPVESLPSYRGGPWNCCG